MDYAVQSYILPLALMSLFVWTVNGICPSDMEPCVWYQSLNDSTRSIAYYSNGGVESDYSLSKEWYRSVSAAGGDMPTEPVYTGQCNAYAPIWLNGSLPQLYGEVINISACASFLDNTCVRQYIIPVKNCGDYNIYCLYAVVDSYDRFCMGEHSDNGSLHSSSNRPEEQTVITTVTAYTPENSQKQPTVTTPVTTPIIQIPGNTQGSRTSVTEQTANPSTRPNFDSAELIPKYGPVAGGTTVIVSGSNLETVEGFWMSPDCGTKCSSYLNISYFGHDFIYRDSEITFTTKPSSAYGFSANTTLSQPERQTYLITFNSSSPWLAMQSGLKFQYRPNPTLIDVTPRETFVSGGIMLTVKGYHIDSVFEPKMYVYTEVRNLTGDQYSVLENARAEVRGIVDSDTQMRCLTPPINVTNRPSETDGNDKTYYNTEMLEFYLGFAFDGYNEYTNLSETNVPSRLLVYRDPIVMSFDNILNFDPDSYKFLDIEGKSFLLGATTLDYKVEIGADSCEIVEVRDNLITCEPPLKEPKVVKSGGYKEGTPRIFLHAGRNIMFLVGYVNYAVDRDIMYIIGGVVGGAVLVAIIVSMVLLCVCKRRKTNPPSSNLKDRGSHPSLPNVYDNSLVKSDDFPNIIK